MNDAARARRSRPGWKERLAGIALALTIQGALFALLVFSLVPHAPPPPPDSERETILFLPRLPQLPNRQPVIIDGRPAPAPQTAPPAPPQDWSPPLYATPGFDLPNAPPIPGSEIGRASCRERV